MQITVALDGEKKRDLRFFAGDDMSLTIVVYAHDGDITPITVSNVRFAAADGSLPMDSEFVVPSNFLGRAPYRIVGEVDGITTTLCYGVMQTEGGWPCVYCWGYCGPGWGIVGKAENITVLDAGNYFNHPANVEDVLQQLAGTFGGDAAQAAALSAQQAEGLKSQTQEFSEDAAEAKDSAQGFSVDAAASAVLAAAVANMATTPTALGKPDPTAPGVDANVFVGGWGTWDNNAASKTRTPWGAIGGPEPVVGVNSLGLTGHTTDAAPNSVIFFGGRPSYYNYAGPTAALNALFGGDNSSQELASFIFAFHSDVLKDVNGVGSHGLIAGGSYQQVGGDYSGSIVGTVKKVFGLQCIALGGRNILIGSNESAALADSTLVRRVGTLGGLNLRFSAGYEGAMISGQNNTHTSGDRSVTVGGENGTMAASYATLLGGTGGYAGANYSCVMPGLRNRTNAIASVAMGRDAVAEIENSRALSGGVFTGGAPGDHQVMDVIARREFTSGGSSVSINGSSGVDLYTPPPNTQCNVVLWVHGGRTDVLGDACSYVVNALFSNVSGALVLKWQSVTATGEDDVNYNVQAAVNGAGARIGLNVFAPSSSYTTRWQAYGFVCKMKMVN